MQQYSPTYQPNIQQGHHRSWGEVTRLHHDIQKQREEYERALEKERQAKYKYMILTIQTNFLIGKSLIS